MDSIRTSIDILPGESDAPPDLSATPRARLSQTLADNLLKARKQSEDTDATIGDDASEPSLAGFALCIEFEKTVEDQELWQSSFGNGLADETLEDRRRRDVPENTQRGKDVLLIWPDVADSSETAKSDEDTLSIPQAALESHPSLAQLLDDFESTTNDIFANVSLVRPPVLTKVILHQVPAETANVYASLDEEEEAKEVLKELTGAEGASVVLRQDIHWTSSRTGKMYAVLLALPFTQGVISSSTTEVVISSSESPPTAHQNGNTEVAASSSSLVDRLAISSSLQHKNLLFGGMARSTASRSTRQQRAMLNFSTDGFLSASLVVDPSRERREAGRQRKVEMRGLMTSKGIDELQEEEEDEDEDPFWDEELDDDQPSDDEGNDTDILLGAGPSSSSSLRSSLSESSGSITPRPGSYLDTDQPFLHTVTDSDAQPRLDSEKHHPVNGYANDHQAEAVNGTDHAAKQAEEQDLFRGFAFEPFPVRRRPLSASTRYFEKIASCGKGKAREETVASVDGSEEGASWPDDEAVVWLSLKGLARAGVFVGDWVLLSSVGGDNDACERLVQVDVIEDFDEEAERSLPAHPIFLPPCLLHNMLNRTSSKSSRQSSLLLLPIPSGQREPPLPVAKSITLARLANPTGVNKKYEKQFTEALRAVFEGRGQVHGRRVVRQGDVIAVPVCTMANDSDNHSLIPQGRLRSDTLVYFQVTDMSYDPLVPLEQDFASSVSSKSRGGELGCWIDVEKTRMISVGVQRGLGIAGTKKWWGIDEPFRPFADSPYRTIRNGVRAALKSSSLSTQFALVVPILLTGARGSGKASLVSHVADELGVHLIEIDGYTLLGDSETKTQGAFQAALEKATDCAPSIFLIRHLEAIGRKDNSPGSNRDVSILAPVVDRLRGATMASGFPTILIATTSESDAVAPELLTVFKQEVEIKAPSETERLDILTQAVGRSRLSPDVDFKYLAAQTAALQAIDLANLVNQARYLSINQSVAACDELSLLGKLGAALSMDDFEQALRAARTSLADSIGAPKIPNVSWDDVGGLSEVKADILDTIQLPLERPELFANGLKKRSGILLYGPPGTGKTLLAKAVATSCSLNFFSVKGPELLNMYIGESEANVRRVFQRARDAQPCVIFMDELDSVAPKRGNQGDSGGVMDRIVSQLLAELDGMSDGSGGAGVFVMAATNRPDLLDPALLRPGRFDRMLYLSVSQDHDTQCKIMEALTRKFKLHQDLSLRAIADQCPFNYTGADFYALCSDAMLKAMSRTAAEVDRKIELLNAQPPPHKHPWPLTPRYYLAEMAAPSELEVVVQRDDFEAALKDLVPSVSAEEMAHYAQVQKQFSKVTMNSKQPTENGVHQNSAEVIGKGKGKAKMSDGEV
ncbi:hypothetical protein NliqN6_0957 [Naganishia liquefaciens]|uniref:Peroxisomal ATPase PEX6 n=1 Tax=Naganishia liquefaciens TaxID=104408 RepID=A0A8H3TQ63_9TREE|nr:hypothetical protein NliqN6_0957 [Naganishia liquefaciens]